jgi:hypothetical protein
VEVRVVLTASILAMLLLRAGSAAPLISEVFETAANVEVTLFATGLLLLYAKTPPTKAASVSVPSTTVEPYTVKEEPRPTEDSTPLDTLIDDPPLFLTGKEFLDFVVDILFLRLFLLIALPIRVNTPYGLNY